MNPIIAPSKFDANPYRDEWFDRDFIFSPDGDREYPEHHCKMTWLASQPFVKSFRNAVDVGCRDGEYSRYLQKYFDHTYSFDPRRFERFSYNVDLAKVTHFTCALGDEQTDIHMRGGSHNWVQGQMWSTPCFRLDDFELDDIDYIKIDVEGFEEKVVRGGMQTIESSWPLIIIEQNDVILAGDVAYSAQNFLESTGYRHVATCPRGWDFIMQKA